MRARWVSRLAVGEHSERLIGLRECSLCSGRLKARSESEHTSRAHLKNH